MHNCIVMIGMAGSPAQVFISFQRPTVTVSTVNQFKDLLRDDLFEIALNRRLYRLSRQEEPPFYSAQVRNVDGEER